jgi:hypothetical protein
MSTTSARTDGATPSSAINAGAMHRDKKGIVIRPPTTCCQSIQFERNGSRACAMPARWCVRVPHERISFFIRSTDAGETLTAIFARSSYVSSRPPRSTTSTLCERIVG